MAAVWSGRDMNEVAGFDRFEPVPDATGHQICITRAKKNLGLDTDPGLVTIIEDQFHSSTDEIEELVAVRVDLAPVRSWPLDVEHGPDRVSVNTPRWSWWGSREGHRPVPSHVDHIPIEADWRELWRWSHTSQNAND